MSENESIDDQQDQAEDQDESGAEDQQAEGQQQKPEADDQEDWKAKYEAQKKRAREWEKVAKGKAGKLQEELLKAQQEAEAAATEALRYKVAAEKQIPLELAERLTGSTKEELAEDADKLKNFLSLKTPPEAYSLDRKPDPEAGHNPNDLLRAALRGA